MEYLWNTGSGFNSTPTRMATFRFVFNLSVYCWPDPLGALVDCNG